jgi:UTP--glucose-1-phosphate uridylyltransferase
MTARIRKAVIPVAGYGTRFLPITKAVPKEMLPIVNRPIIEYVVREFVEAGIEEIIFISSSNKHALEDYFDDNNELNAQLVAKGKTEQLEEVRELSNLARFTVVRQREQLGNGHALLQARHLIGDEPFAFGYGDDIYDAHPPAISQLMETFHAHPGTVVGVISVPRSLVDRYGVIDPGESVADDQLTIPVRGIVEKPSPDTAPSTLVTNGRFIFTPAIFEALDQAGVGKHGEIWVNDGIVNLLNREPVIARRIIGSYHDCGNVAEYVKTVIHYGLKDPVLANELRNWLREEIQRS